jgi:group I intron endonuclease
MGEINGYIYLLTDTRNGKQYIGKHNGSDENYFSGGVIPNKIAKKYGKEIFIKTIIEENITDINLLSIKEKFYIKEYRTFIYGYNLSEGGDGGGSWIHKKTKEEKERISEIKRKKNLGRKFSNETLEKMRLAKKGKPLSDEHKKNISISQSGENHPWFGRKHTDETKKKISEKRKGIKNEKHSDYMKKNNPKNLSVLINGRIFDSIQQASEELNIPRHVVKTKLNSLNYPNWIKIKKNDT